MESKTKLIVFLFLITANCSFPLISLGQNCSVNAGIDESFCADGQMELQGNVSAINADYSTLAWSIVSQPVGADVSIDNPNSLYSTISGTTITGTYIFEITVQCTDLVYTTDQVTHTILDGPGTALVSSSMNAGCYTGGGINISGNAPGAGETVSWTILNGSGTLTNGNTQTVTFYPEHKKYECWEGANGYESILRYTKTKNGCTSSDEIIVNYTFAEDGYFVEAVPSFTCSLCTQLYAACSLDGTGVWTYTGPGTATFNSGSNSANTSVCVDTEGEYIFTWTTTGGCRTGSDQVAVTFNDMGGLPLASDAGSGGSWCTFPSTLVLTADPAGTGLTGAWTQVGGLAATITDTSSANTTVTGITSGGGPYEFAWTVTPDGGGICSVSDTVSFYESFPWGLQDQLDYDCFDNYSSLEAYFLKTDNYPWNALDSVDITIIFNEAPYPFDDTVFFSWSYRERESFTDNSGFDVSLGSDTAVVGVPNTFTVTRTWLESRISAMYRDEDYFSITTILAGNAGNYPTGYYDFDVKIADECSTYSFNRSFVYSVKNGFDTPNAGTDIVLSCGTSSASLAGTGVYAAFPEVHRGIWTMISGPGSTPLTAESARETNPVLTGLVSGTYVFRYASDYGPECDQVYDEVRVVVSNAGPTISSLSIGNPGFCGTGPVEINSLFSSDAHPDSVSWQITSPSPTTETISDTSDVGESTATLTNLLKNTSYTVEIRVANTCGSSTQTINFTTDNTDGPTLANILTEDQCTFTGLVTLEADAVTSGTGTWSILSEPAGSLATIDDPSANPTTATGFTNLISGRWVFKWEVSSVGCSSTSSDTVVIARGTLMTPDAGPDQDHCGVSLPYTSAMQASIDAGDVSRGIYGEWRFLSGPSQPTIPNIHSPTTDVTYDDYGEYIFAWVSTSGISCLEEMDIVSVVVGEGAPVAYAGEDQSQCGGSNVFTLDALDLGVGESGTWSVSSTTGNAGVTFADLSDPNTSATIYGAGNVTLRWSTFSNTSGCPPNFDEVTISYVPEANAGADLSFCEASSTMLIGNSFGGISGISSTWSLISGPNSPTIDEPSRFYTLVTGLSQGTYVFRYSITDGSCTSFDDITVQIDTMPETSANDDFVFCDGETINLSGTSQNGGEATTWNLLIGDNTGTFDDASSTSTTYGSISATSDVYLFSFLTSNGVCSAYDYVAGYRLRDAALEIAQTDPTCGNTDGSIDLSVAGDDGSMSYLWNTGAVTQDINTLASGKYSVTVTHPSGCTADTYTLLINTDGPAVTNSATTICPNNEATITATVSGGTAPYDFLWEGGETTESITLTLSADSILFLTITDDTGCDNPGEIPLIMESVATLSLGNDIMNCGGGNVQLVPRLSSRIYSSAFYSEDFESDLGIWVQATNGVDDDSDWIRDGYGTPSSSTGPSSGNGDNFYLYTEASSNYNQQHILTSAAIDLTGRTGTGMIFSYHMYGSSMGTLELFTSTDSTTWTSVFNQSGNQGNSWITDTIDLSAYDGISTLYLRFNGTTGSGIQSDMAIDNISLAESQESYLWSTGATTSTITVDPGSDTEYYLDVTDINGCVLSDTVMVNVDCLFPVEWLDFRVEQKGADAVLSWATAQEMNSDYFDIERSVDQVAFEMIGKVSASGNSTQINEYDFTDHLITAQPNPVLFYRLRQVDLDGKFEYSNVVELQLIETDQLLLLVFPNPADQRITVRYIFTGNHTGSKTINIMDAMGKLMLEKPIIDHEAEGEFQLSTENWAEGYYFIQLKSNAGSDVFKLEVR